MVGYLYTVLSVSCWCGFRGYDYLAWGWLRSVAVVGVSYYNADHVPVFEAVILPRRHKYQATALSRHHRRAKMISFHFGVFNRRLTYHAAKGHFRHHQFSHFFFAAATTGCLGIASLSGRRQPQNPRNIIGLSSQRVAWVILPAACYLIPATGIRYCCCRLFITCSVVCTPVESS